MRGDCTYCNSLKRALGDVNYCSQEGDSIADVSTNAYYFNTNSLYSGEHISRMSIRTIGNGYQRYKVDDKNYTLDRDKYLVIPEGVSFSSELNTNAPVEGILVAFSDADVRSMIRVSTSTDIDMLDDPFSDVKHPIELSIEGVDKSLRFHKLMSAVKQGVKNKEISSFYFQELFDQLLAEVVSDKLKGDDRINTIKSTRRSTKVEISRRLRLTREYIDCNISEDLSLDVLSRVATMSKFHLARNFKNYFELSPRQYIIKKRLDRAKFLLLDSDDSLNNILQKIGLQNKSSFTRLFMKMEGKSTAEFRAKK